MGNYYIGKRCYLAHYGIPGQKKGVRRFQNLDRTWTEAGKIRYGSGKNGDTHKSSEKTKKYNETEERLLTNLKKRNLYSPEELKTLQKKKKNDLTEEEKNKMAKTQSFIKSQVDLEHLKRDLKNPKVMKDFEPLPDDFDLNKVKSVEEIYKVLKPKHDTNSNADAKKFIARLALDLFVPGMQVYLPLDAVRVGEAVAGNIKSKKYQKERDRKPIDEKTGFHLETENLSEKESIKRVNPEVNDFNSNTKSNCVLCTMTMELRSRGYDVTANKAGQGYFDEELNSFFPKYKVIKFENENMNSNKSLAAYGANTKYAKNIIEQIERTQPEGSRGNLSVNWGAGGGHSMYYQIKDGKMIVYDGQIAKIYKNPVNILKNCSEIRIGRLDNLKFDTNGIKECCK